MQVFFSTLPTTNGSYKIVDEVKATNHTLASDEVAVEFNVSPADVYISKGTGTIFATVTVDSNGK